MLLNRQQDQLNRWTQTSGSELKQNILLEQFLQSLPTDLAVKLKERKPATAKEAASWADDYDLAHRGDGQREGQIKQPAMPASRDATRQCKDLPQDLQLIKGGQLDR